MSELSQSLNWTFTEPIATPSWVQELFAEGEKAIAAYKTIRDNAIFTNKRLIVVDSQGITGKKKEMYSLPYSSINMWSTENAGGIIDHNSEVELWTRAGHIKVKLHKSIDIRQFDKVLATALL